MRLSIVIPARNGERFLAATIRSALAQSREADEILVIDDDSGDATAAIAQSGEWCGKVRYHFNAPASGYVDAWNRAARLALGDYVAILHQDDLLHPEFLEQMVAALQRYPHVRHLYAACNYIDGQGTVTRSPAVQAVCEPVLSSGRDYARAYLRGVATNSHIHRCPGVVTKRDLLLNECLYRKEAGHIADDDFFMRVGAYTDVIGLAQPLASYRNHADSETSRLDLMSLRLARDYVFQAESNRSETTLLDADGVALIDSLAVRFINLLLFQALNLRRDDWSDEAFSLRDAHEKYAPALWGTAVPTWAKPMWMLAGSASTRGMAKGYVSVLQGGHTVLSRLKKGFSG